MLVPLCASLCNLRDRKSHSSARYILFIEFKRYLFASVVCFLALVFVHQLLLLLLFHLELSEHKKWKRKSYTPTLSGIVNTRRISFWANNLQNMMNTTSKRVTTLRSFCTLFATSHLQTRTYEMLEFQTMRLSAEIPPYSIVNRNGFDAKFAANTKWKWKSTVCLHISQKRKHVWHTIIWWDYVVRWCPLNFNETMRAHKA